MNNYSIDSAIAGKVASIYTDEQNKNELNDIVKSIKKINDSFGLVDLPEYSAPDFTRLENIDKSQTDIENEAKLSLEGYKNSSLSDIDSSIENQRVSLEKNRDTLKKSKEDAVNEVSSSYNAIRNNASNDALKRGLARSSIVINQLNAFDNKQIEEFKKIDEDIASSVAELESEIELLNQKKQNALNNFDITYAVKLNEKISQLTSEVQKYNDEVLEYNNKIAEQERAYYDKLKSEQDDRNREVYEFLNEYGGKMLDSRLNSYKADYVISYLDSLSKQDALAILSDSEEIKSALGDDYEKVFSHFKNK